MPELGAGSSLLTSAISLHRWAPANRQERVSGFTATRVTWQEPVESDTLLSPPHGLTDRPRAEDSTGVCVSTGGGKREQRAGTGLLHVRRRSRLWTGLARGRS